MSEKQPYSKQPKRSVLRSGTALNWGIAVVSAISLAIVLSVGWAQSSNHASEGHYLSYAQQFNHPSATDFRFDRNSLTGNQVLTVWEAAQERKTEREGKEGIENPPHSYEITVACTLHERKSQFAQLQRVSETPGVSLVVLYHSWKGYLS